MIEIGSSDAAAVLGVSPFLTPWRLWAKLVGLIEPHDEPEPDEVMRAGSKLEPAVIDMTCEDIGLQHRVVFTSPGTRLYHGERTWQRATPDGVFANEVDGQDEEQIIETKCVIGQPPPVPRVEWVVQALHQLLVYEDATRCHLACFGGLRLVRWEIPRHQAALDRVLRAEEAFLDLVAKEIPPPVRAEDGPSLWRAWPLVSDAVTVLPADALAWDRTMVEAQRRMVVAEHEYEEARAKLKAAIGQNARGVLPDGSASFTYRRDARGFRTLRRKSTNEEE